MSDKQFKTISLSDINLMYQLISITVKNINNYTSLEVSERINKEFKTNITEREIDIIRDSDITTDVNDLKLIYKNLNL